MYIYIYIYICIYIYVYISVCVCVCACVCVCDILCLTCHLCIYRTQKYLLQKIADSMFDGNFIAGS